MTQILSDIQAAAEKLNRRTDEIAAHVRAIEERLASIGVGIETDIGNAPVLAYKRIGKRFRIAAAESKSDPIRAWSDCSRSLKLDSIGMLADLLALITSKLEAMAANALQPSPDHSG